MTRLERWLADGREVAVVGLGKSGVAAARLLHRLGIRVYASDLSEKHGQAAADLERELSQAGAVEVGRHDLERITSAVAVVVSPGVPPNVPVLIAARDAGVEVISEAQLGLDALAGVPYVSVTGTNGKSTVTAMVAHLMQQAGRNAPAAGNIGTAISAVALESARPDWLAVELSSFQLHDLPDMRPVVGVLTNLSADHLDRYRDIDEYLADKRKMFANATAASIWVSNLDDQLSRDMMHGVEGRHLSFSLRHRADGWIDGDSGWLMLGSQRLLQRDDLHLLGDHNVANALAAALAVHATGVSIEQLAQGLTSFRALEHRMEPVATVNDVRYINDSKATNVASTRVALEAMDRPYVLMLGGFHKGEPYTSLGEVLGRAVAVVAYGAAADLVMQDLTGVVRLERAGAFEEAVRKAASLAPSGGAVLLSPACSSYDQFNNYEERGRAFREIVATL